jgi:hypothetical protein
VSAKRSGREGQAGAGGRRRGRRARVPVKAGARRGPVPGAMEGWGIRGRSRQGIARQVTVREMGVAGEEQGWGMPGQRGEGSRRQQQLVGLRVQLDGSAVRAAPSRMDVLLLTERSQPHLRRDRARPCHFCAGTGPNPAYVCSRTGLIPCHICTGTWLFPPPHRHPDSARPLRRPPAPVTDAPHRRPSSGLVGNRSLRGRSRAKLALAEALARLVRNPRDHASTPGGVVERGPLRTTPAMRV